MPQAIRRAQLLELVPVPGLGAKTIKRLYEEVGVDSLAALRAAIDEGKLKGFKGIGKKTLEKFEAYLDAALVEKVNQST